MEKIFEEAIKRFEEQFKVELEPTGYEIDYEENDGIGEVEYWVHGLIESKTDAIEIDVGGWFSHDTRDSEDRIYCLLGIKINGQLIGDCQGLQSWYIPELKKWEDLTWDHF